MTAMLSDSKIIECVDIARRLCESSGRKDSRFYAKGFLAKTFGIYTKPQYPKGFEIRSIEDLWVRFQPRSADDLQKATLLAEWSLLLGIPETSTKEQVLDRITLIKKRQQLNYQEGLAKGIKYQFMNPFESLCREISRSGKSL
ncbi:MAG: hypothetical protein C0422_05020 [Alcaligenaceae bacterium]|nr:hypothetical protein [Alcaligenaceae bacterium]